MIINCDIPIDEKTIKHHTKVMLDLGLRSYSFYYKGHPVTFCVTTEHPHHTSPYLIDYYASIEKSKKRTQFLIRILLLLVIGLSAGAIMAMSLSANALNYLLG